MCNDNKNKGPRSCLGWDSGAGRVWTAQRRAVLYSRQECPASSPPNVGTYSQWARRRSHHHIVPGGTCAQSQPLVDQLPSEREAVRTEDAGDGFGGTQGWTSRDSECAGNAPVPVRAVAAERSAASRGKWGDQRKSCQQWLNKLEREIMWMRARPAPALPSARKAGSHREKCVGWWETRVVIGWGWVGGGGWGWG